MHKFSIVPIPPRVVSPGDFAPRAFANISTFPTGTRLLPDGTIAPARFTNITIFNAKSPNQPIVSQVSHARLTLGTLDGTISPARFTNSSTLSSATTLAVQPAPGTFRLPALTNTSTLSSATTLAVAPADGSFRLPALTNVSTFGSLALHARQPFSLEDWPNPLRARWLQPELLNSTALRTTIAVPPFSLEDWPNPLRARWPQPPELLGGAALRMMPPFSLEDWPNPLRARWPQQPELRGSLQSALVPPPPTTWDPTSVTGHGTDFALSNSNLTVAGAPMTMAIAVDLTNGKIWARVGNGAWTGTSGNPATNTAGNSISGISGTVYPAFSTYNKSISTFNGGGTPFQCAVPSGFTAWDAGATWDSGNKDASITLMNGSLTATGTLVGSWKSVRATTGHSTGKYYFELGGDFIDTSSGWMGGIENASGTLSSYLGSTANGAGWQCSGTYYINAGNPGANTSLALTKFSSTWRSARSDTSHTNGKYYVEITCDAVDASNTWGAGITNGSGPLANFLGFDNNSAAVLATGTYYRNNSGITSFVGAITATHVLCLAIDLTNNRLWARVDGGTWSGTSGNPATNTGGADISSINDAVAVYLGFSAEDSGSFDQATLNAGATSYAFTPPSGFGAW